MVAASTCFALDFLSFALLWARSILRSLLPCLGFFSFLLFLSLFFWFGLVWFPYLSSGNHFVFGRLLCERGNPEE
jgi:hypothetical protein